MFTKFLIIPVKQPEDPGSVEMHSKQHIRLINQLKHLLRKPLSGF